MPGKGGKFVTVENVQYQMVLVNNIRILVAEGHEVIYFHSIKYILLVYLIIVFIRDYFQSRINIFLWGNCTMIILKTYWIMFLG